MAASPPVADSSRLSLGMEVQQKTMQDYTEDLSYGNLDSFPEFLAEHSSEIDKLLLDHNEISVIPRLIGSFTNLVLLDISFNSLSYISSEIIQLKQLQTLHARNNRLDEESLPKDMGLMKSLHVINFSGNLFNEFPMQLTEMTSLKCLQLGANNIAHIPAEIANLKRLEVLYLGGNKLTELPEEVGYLSSLVSLYLCDNQLTSLPRSMGALRRLQSLSLHNNQISTLPPEIVKLNLIELSLRNNPLVVRFVQDMVIDPPSLLELAGRVIKVKNIHYEPDDLPANLIDYLDSAQRCVNPKCKGVFFTSRVEHVKFVDFCGKYRLPLLEYLCSSHCKTSPVVYTSSESESEDEAPVVSKMRKVLLG